MRGKYTKKSSNLKRKNLLFIIGEYYYRYKTNAYFFHKPFLPNYKLCHICCLLLTNNRKFIINHLSFVINIRTFALSIPMK